MATKKQATKKQVETIVETIVDKNSLIDGMKSYQTPETWEAIKVIDDKLFKAHETLINSLNIIPAIKIWRPPFKSPNRPIDNVNYHDVNELMVINWVTKTRKFICFLSDKSVSFMAEIKN